MPTTLTVDQILERLRKRAKKTTVRKLAQEMDMHFTTIHYYLKGKRSPSGMNLVKLMQKLY